MKRRDFITTMGSTVAALSMTGCLNVNTRSSDKPNIVFILADDLGWSELGCYGNLFHETPNMDSLASEGMRFTDAYAAAPVCSPTRAAFMTGQYPARVGITRHLAPWDDLHLPTNQLTIAESLKKAGYKTGMIGKWHLSGYANHGAKEFPPAMHGFDETIISENRGIGGGSYFFPYHFNREIKKRLPGNESLIDRMNLEAVEFIERHQNSPFFLFLSHYAVHTMVHGKDELVAKYATEEVKAYPVESRKRKHNNPHLAAQLESIDTGVGVIRDKLNDLGLADNTIIIFTSDNGGGSRVTSNAPLREGKGRLYEGGIRVPLIIYWPKTVQEGKVCNDPISTYDFYPTFLEAAETSPDSQHHLDGISFMPLIKNQNNKIEREALYWHYPYERGPSSSAVRKDEWKLIEFLDDKRVELYNLGNDISEKNDLATEYPEKVKELHAMLVDWRKKVHAEYPGKLPKKQ